ncbi:MAG TPA: F0F1 ATP synthase subunit delta [Aliiroseovarius sp.]|nr:F0F1 ATP synthase subunit delta [Aliiroseovarius sp.]
MSEPVSISTGIANRYAKAVFDLALEGKSIKAVEADLAVLEAALGDSTEMNALISSPLVTRDQQRLAVAALAAKMKLSDIMTNALGLKADKRRLYLLPQFISELQRLLAEHKGEVTAEVTAAKALTKTQKDKLAKALKAAAGKDVNINVAVDEDLIGGLVIKLGSKMIDTSIRSRLNALQNSMKEVG